jgi:methionine aminopeptidase
MSDSGNSSDDEQDETKANDLSDPEIMTKYRLAGDIATKTLAAVLAKVAVGVTPLALCDAGDALINEACAGCYNKNKKMEKGVAFPTCVSVNNCVGHFSPLAGEDGPALVAGDVVKVRRACNAARHAACATPTIVQKGRCAQGVWVAGSVRAVRARAGASV